MKIKKSFTLDAEVCFKIEDISALKGMSHSAYVNNILKNDFKRKNLINYS